MALLVFLIPSIIFFLLHWIDNLPLNITFNLVGIVSNAAGALWIASGVYLLAEDSHHIIKGNKSRSKLLAKLSNLFVSASRTIPYGIICIVTGSIFQVIAALID